LTAVADTNVLAALMLPTAENKAVAALFRLDPDWRMPPLWQSEFRHVLLKYVRSGLIEAAQAQALWQKAVDRFGLQAEQVDGQRVLELAIRSGCSSYDAEFVVLAEQLGCRLLTYDRKLLQLFPETAVQPT
jgi:predicted nucleic acid-binding protein